MNGSDLIGQEYQYPHLCGYDGEVDAPLITSQSELDALCRRSIETGRMAIDTEFLWEKTYAPLLCLIQMRVDGETILVDPLTDIDITPIANLISNPDVVTIMHAPHADLVAFAARCDAFPHNVFDTQLAAGFVGLSAGLSYERLVESMLDIQVQPSESFSDWSKRPLSSRQLAYAAEDVEYLDDMYDELMRRLKEMGRVDWALDEIARRFTDPARLITEPEIAYRKVSRRNKLRSNGMGVLREAAAWRERKARSRDIPTSWVMKDATLVEIARRNPTSERELRGIRGVEKSMQSQEAIGLIRALQNAKPVSSDSSDIDQSRALRTRVGIAKGLVAGVMRTICEDNEIAPELVGTSSDLENLIAHVTMLGSMSSPSGDLPALLQGWRRELVGNDLTQLINGEVTVRLIDEPPYLEMLDL